MSWHYIVDALCATTDTQELIYVMANILWRVSFFRYNILSYVPAKHILIKIFIFFIPNWFFGNIRLSILQICFHICESSIFDVRILQVVVIFQSVNRLVHDPNLTIKFPVSFIPYILNVGFDLHSWCCMFFYISSSRYDFVLPTSLQPNSP